MLVGVHFLESARGSEHVQHRRPKRVVKHPSFDKATYANDIALVELDEPIHFTGSTVPACLPNNQSSLSSTGKCVLIGWGTMESRLQSKILMQA